MKRAARFFDAIEACYRVDLDESAWVANVADKTARVVSTRLGLAALIYDGDHRGVSRRMHFAAGCDPRWAVEFLEQIHRAHLSTERNEDRLARASAHVHAACSMVKRPCTTMRTAPSLVPFASAISAWGGARDLLVVQGFDPSGAGVWLGVPRKSLVAPSRDTLVKCARLATHLAVGLRTRRVLAEARAMEDAVVAPDGRVVHAEPSAKGREQHAVLRRAVLALDRARLSGTDDDLASGARKGLVDASWSLLDRFESDGRRFFVAVRNDSDVPSHRALSERERQVLAHAALGHHNKEIAYDLGLAQTTVRVLLHRAAKKLGVTGRRAAIERFNRASLSHKGAYKPT